MSRRAPATRHLARRAMSAHPRTSITSVISAVSIISIVAVACTGGSAGPPSTTVPLTFAPAPTAPPSTTIAPATSPPEITVSTEPPESGHDVPAGVNWSPASEPIDVAAGDEVPGGAATLPMWDELVESAGAPEGPPLLEFTQFPVVDAVFQVAGATYAAAESYWTATATPGLDTVARRIPYLFRSTDGTTWTRADLGEALADVDGVVGGLTAIGDRLVAVVTVTDPAHLVASKVAVIGSDDGISWTRVGEMAGYGSIRAGELHVVGDAIVHIGYDDVCSFDGAHVRIDEDTPLQARAWTSADLGLTWVEVPKPSAALDVKASPPTSPEGCTGDVVGERELRYESRPRSVAVIDDHLIVWSADSVRVAATDDGATWTQSILEGAFPTASILSPDVAPQSNGSALFPIGGGGALALNVEPPRRADGSRPAGLQGAQVFGWRTDDGTTWRPQLVGRPFGGAAVIGARGRFDLVGDQIVLSMTSATDSTVVFQFTSTVSPEEDWQTCTLTAGASCTYAERYLGAAEDVDLTGIDLSGALVGAIDLNGANFTEAVLVGTTFSETSLVGADFTEADLSNATLLGDVTGARFTGASFFQVSTDGRIFAADLDRVILIGVRVRLDLHPVPPGTSFAAASLTKVTFTGSPGVLGDLRGMDFSGAQLIGASFVSVDLTFANFAEADVSIVSFDATTICPDGQLAAPAAPNAEACRL